jgi:predicted molibdopterin-dependent oxidoreductase YjgC
MAGVRPLGKGKDVYEMLYKPGSVKALYIMGENPLVALPDVNTVEHTLQGLEFLVVQDIFLTDTAKRADVVLPACSWAEKEGSFMSATGQIQRIPKLVPEKGDARADWMIVAGIAAAMGQDLGFSDIQQVRAAVSDLVVSAPAGEMKPSFAVANYQVLEQPDESYPMVLATSIILQHSGSLSALSKNLDSVVSDAYLQINAVDAQQYGIRHEDFVRVTSRRGEVILKAIVSDEVPAGTVFAPIHFAHVKVNTLTYPSLNGGIPLVAVKLQSL